MDTALRVLPYEARSLSVVEGLAEYPIAAPDMGAFERHCPTQNQILAALPDGDYARIRPYLDFVQLPLGMMLHETSGRSSFAYFPTAGIVSPLCMMQNGAAAAVAITGNDGMIGTSLFMGRGGTPDRAVVQSPGHAYRLGANRLRTFRSVTLPLMVPGLAAAGIFAFTLSLDEFIITFLLTSTTQTLPLYVWGMLRTIVSPTVNAVATLIVAASLALLGGMFLVQTVVRRRASGSTGG